MIIKEGVNIQGLKLEMRPVLMYANRIWKKHGKELAITSGMDGTHHASSLHYYGYAVDLRTRYFSDKEKQTIASELKHMLGDGYDVITEKDHIHAEYQAILW